MNRKEIEEEALNEASTKHSNIGKQAIQLMSFANGYLACWDKHSAREQELEEALREIVSSAVKSNGYLMGKAMIKAESLLNKGK